MLTESVHHRDVAPLGLWDVWETDKSRWKTEGRVTGREKRLSVHKPFPWTYFVRGTGILRPYDEV